MKNAILLAAAAVMFATSAYALEPRQPSGAAGEANLKAFQVWVHAPQPKHIPAASRACHVPIWAAACGGSIHNGYDGYNDRDGGGKGDGAGGHDSKS